MTKYIIKASGNIQDIIKELKTIQATFGKGATLSTVGQVVQKQRLKQAIENQLNEIKKGW